MFGRHRIGSAVRRTAAVAISLAIVLAGCASADKNLTVPSSSTAPTAASLEQLEFHVRNEHGSVSPSSGSVSVNGVKVVPTQLLGSALWQGMKISAEATTPLPFVIYNGTSEQMVKAGRKRLSPDGDAERRPDWSRDPVRERVGDDLT